MTNKLLPIRVVLLTDNQAVNHWLADDSPEWGGMDEIQI